MIKRPCECGRGEGMEPARGLPAAKKRKAIIKAAMSSTLQHSDTEKLSFVRAQCLGTGRL